MNENKASLVQIMSYLAVDSLLCSCVDVRPDSPTQKIGPRSVREAGENGDTYAR